MSPTNNTPHSILHPFAEAKAILAEHIKAYVPTPKVTRFEVKVKPVDQMLWLSAQQSDVKIFGANQDDSAGIAGVGEALSEKGRGRGNFSKALTAMRSFLTPQYPYMQWYGGFGFDGATPDDKDWQTFGAWRFVLPRFELARDGDKMIFCCNLCGDIDRASVLKELIALIEAPKAIAVPLFQRERMDFPDTKKWAKGVNTVLKSISAGQYQKVVLARKTTITFKEKLNPWLMLRRLKAVTPDSYHFAFQFGGATFLGASPERLYKRRGRMIVSEALAGTKPRSAKPEVLLSSAKDRHEHKIVVDAIAADLGALCSDLKFDPQPSVLTLSNGHHLKTEFSGHLKDGVQDEDVLQSLHPTPALGGAPRDKAGAAIRRIETFNRGWYAGPLGYVGLDWAEFVVGIRSGLVRGRELTVFAGAGIVEGSDPESEWQEIENKISNFIKIIE